jgi:metal-responsive CopG/Arc/MetJ family transcriptional regulator
MVQLNDDLVTRLDERAAAGGVSRSHLIRQAVEAFLDADVHAEAVRRFRAAYRTLPETDQELRDAEAAARAMVQGDPW